MYRERERFKGSQGGPKEGGCCLCVLLFDDMIWCFLL